jgi:lysyl-tRNA synthetase class 2
MSSGSKNSASAIRRKRLKLRSKVIAAIRAWLDKKGFIEVQTPLLIDAPAPEPYIETFSIPDAIHGKTLYLIPSPELNLKRLLAEGFKRIYQMGPVFRKNERGERHLSEFTLLEWYRTDADYRDLMADCEAIVQVAAKASGLSGGKIVYGETNIDIRPPFIRLTVEDAFMKYAGWRPGSNPDQHRYDEDMTAKIEPGLPRDRPVFLIDYPASCAALARLKTDNPSVAERVELYMGGLELSNGFSELTDQSEQEQRFKKDMALRKRLGLEVYPLPQRFISCLEGLPPCAGMALGIDRLIMLLANAPSINDVVAFTHEIS